eukprot:comp18576_c0_seq1/m.20075 comp18576_c0_seq1/g.20075  ORF comp18576_c0_seq1/g.20075 comp18576_c0_seq1/m.20075 type:complete len:272 (-) comp18576_c0_seq1:41-856(-)
MADAKTQLLKWCKADERRGEEAVGLGETLLKTKPGVFGDQVWDMYEYMAIAALDCCRPDLAQYCVEKLTSKFPKSVRARRLGGLMFEAEGDMESAVQVYEDLLELDPTNQAIRKRMIATLKARGSYDAAIENIVKYLEVYMTDSEAWAELAMLYLRDGRYGPAGFCVEELILANPTTDAYFVLYGEIMYAQKRFDMARKYYGKAAELNKKNLKALYGVFMSCVSFTGPNQGDNDDLGRWAHERIVEHYGQSGMGDVVDRTLKQLWADAVGR